MEQLSGMDASFLYFETPHSPMHIGSFAIYDPSTAPNGFVRFKDILAHIESRLHLSRAFRQKLVHVPMNLDHPYWVDDNDFDLEFHVRHIALPKPGDWRQLCIQAARLHSRALDMSKPPWEMYVIEGLDNVEVAPPGSFAVLQKIHHAMIDGVSGSEIAEYIHDVEPNPADKPEIQPWEPEAEPNPFDLIARANFNMATQPFRFMEVLTRSMPGMARLSQGLRSNQLKATGQAPRTRFNAPVTSHRVVDGKSFDFQEIKSIRRSVEGSTVNDVVISIIGGALRRYLDFHDELPETSLIAMVPISVRSEDKGGSAGNQVSGMAVEIGSQIEDPVERLEYIHTSTSHSKALANAIGAKTLADYSQFIPSQLAGLASRLISSPAMRAMTQSAQPAFNTTISNVPGPQQPLFFAGAKAAYSVGLGIVSDGMGIFHTVYSYCGQLAISFTACRELLPDPDQYSIFLQESFEEMLAAADAPSAAETEEVK
ncbi:MAG: wax ester/triacylglycerol synthase family O-acyltransferase [Chloroflexota bacterium]|nr:wax ester/triacylglycerol synthase family O-acyltransferase [Chloroflexota bacterium]